jgi:hypothetical protein
MQHAIISCRSLDPLSLMDTSGDVSLLAVFLGLLGRRVLGSL